MISTTYKERSRVQDRHCHSAHGIVSVDRWWRLQVASSFWRKTRRLPDDVVPRGEQETRDGKEETETGTRTGEREGRNGDENENGLGGENGDGMTERIWEASKW